MTFIPQVAHSLMSHGGNDKHDTTLQTYVAHTLKANRGKAGGGIGHEETLVAADGTLALPLPELPQADGVAHGGLSAQLAAPLSHGSNPNSNAAGRRREDDENLVATSITLASDPISAENLAQPSTKRNGDPGVVQVGASVRRLMPVECERLQALPDGWTDLDGTADSKRYAALGDAVTASVAEWIGRRLVAA